MALAANAKANKLDEMVPVLSDCDDGGRISLTSNQGRGDAIVPLSFSKPFFKS